MYSNDVKKINYIRYYAIGDWRLGIGKSCTFYKGLNISLFMLLATGI